MEEKIKKSKKTDWLGTVGLSLILSASVLIVWFFLRGQTTIRGDNPDNKTSESVSCEIEGIEYPYADLTGMAKADKTTMDVNIISNDRKVSSISLVYKLFYSDIEKAAGVEGKLSFTVSRNMSLDGLGSDGLGASFVAANGVARMSLYATLEELNSMDSRKYFLVKSATNSVDDFVKDYENQGFECVEKNTEV